MTVITLNIEGMTCERCAQAIDRALAALPGVKARVSYAKGQAYVDHMGQSEAPAIVAAITAAGYGVIGSRPAQQSAMTNTEGQGLHVAIIGSGSAAFSAALRATQGGARVTMIESGVLGGTCVNVGCVPSKILIRAAETAQAQAHPRFRGLACVAPRIDRAALLEQQQARVLDLRQQKYQHVLESHPTIRLLAGHARFVDTRTLHIEGEAGGTVVADRFLIATGARPDVPAIPGLAETPYWTSTEALSAAHAPRHLIVLGASVVALELAQAFLRLGSRVTLLARGALLSREDPDIGLRLAKVLSGEGMTIHINTMPARVTFEGARFRVDTSQGEITGDRLLVATGRRPKTEDLGLEAIGVACDSHGHIVVDDLLRTSIPHIYAAGDCTTQPQFVYVAARAGRCAAAHMVGSGERLDLTITPAVVFTDPQVATVGMTLAQAQGRGLQVEARTLDLAYVPRALVNFDTEGFIRIVAERGTGRVMGAQIVAAQAGEIIQVAALAIQAKMTTSDLAGALFPYLTMVEGLKLCAQTFTQDVGSLSCCAG